MGDHPRSTTVRRIRERLGSAGKAPAAAGAAVDELLLLGPRAVAVARRDDAPRVLETTHRRRLYRWIWDDAAARIGAVVDELPGGFLELRWGGSEMRVYEQLVPVDDPVTLRFAGDKPAAHAALTAAGVRVPEHLDAPVTDVAAMHRFVASHRPCVVKPARGGGSGHGVTGGVRSIDDLLRARLRAARWDPARVLVEEQVVGSEHRVLVLDGQVIATVCRRPPELVGDGRSTVLDLMVTENQRRVDAAGSAGIVGLRASLDTVLALRDQGLRLGSVPRPGRRVVVASTTSPSSERDAEAVRVPDVEEIARRAAHAIGARLVSVELIVDLHSDARGITVIEVNTTPGLAHHYLVRDPATAVPVAETIARSLLGAAVTGRRQRAL